MKLNRLFILTASLLATASAALADSESLASILTNVPSSSVAHQRVIPRRSSILLISCQGLSLGDLSCYGQTNFQTPNLDRLAREGMRFTDFSAGGDDLASAQGALMAGNHATFSPAAPTLASALRAGNYHTGLIGEWALGEQPLIQGFDEFAGYLSEQEADDFYAEYYHSFAPVSAAGVAGQSTLIRSDIYHNSGGQKNEYIPDFLVDASVNFIRIHAPNRASHFKPFFLLLSLSAPHSSKPGKDEYTVPTDAPFSGENWPQAAKNRAALILRLDSGVGRLFEQLNQSGMSNNIAIFLTGAVAPEKFADTNMNFLCVKGEVRGGTSPDRLRVPMIAHWPGHVPAGHVSSVPWSAVDFAPTVQQIAFGNPVSSFAGISIMPALLGNPGTNAPDLRALPRSP